MTKKKIKRNISKNKVLSFFIKPIYRIFYKKRKFDSQRYWEERYAQGGNSGAGSYGRLAEYKAEIINDFVKTYKVSSAIEFGCGDGNQLSLLNIPQYIGLDVSNKSIEMCKKRFKSDDEKTFFIYDSQSFIDKFQTFKADLTLSLDVIFHLIEDDVFEKHMQDLFSYSERYVIIYSSNTTIQEKTIAEHFAHRKFSDWIDEKQPDWKLVKKIMNKYPLENNNQKESVADFYFYQKE